MDDIAQPSFASPRFRLLRELGRGATGIVYLAQDDEFAQTVALKTLARETNEELYALKQEFRALADIAHENLIDLFELFVTSAGSYFTMEWIDGQDVLSWVRRANGDENGGGSSGRADYDRLRDAARQIAAGLEALHDAGKVHRDIKPSNVLVDRLGRTVLLDFGFSARIDPTAVRGDGVGTFVGSPSYAAPELFWGSTSTPSSDWYALGSLLFETITGRLPFEGSRVLDKTHRSAPRARDRVAGVPDDLDELVAELLEADPDRRPDGRSILSRLGASITSPTATSLRGTSLAFIGREHERAQLAAEWAAAREAAGRCVHVRGPSGVGKTELLARFVGDVEGDERSIVLRGRCHPHESLPLRALDELIDDLTRVLCGLPRSELELVLPHRAVMLRTLFPALARVDGGEAPPPKPPDLDPHQARLQGLEELRNLLTHLASRRRLGMWIDDAQWGDEESALVLVDVLRPPSPVELLILSYRAEDAPRSALLQALAGPLGNISARPGEIDVCPFSRDESLAAARAIVGFERHLSDADLDRIARESAGLPFLVTELAARTHHPDASRAIEDADPVLQRVRALPLAAREVVETVCAVGIPVGEAAALEAAGSTGQQRSLVRRLCVERVLRATPVRGRKGIEPYHDRIRVSVLGSLSGSAVAQRKLSLAEVLERKGDAPPDVLAQLFHGGGKPRQASGYAEQAAEEASSQLAFTRAGNLFGLAAEWWPGSPERRRALLDRQATAYVNGGRCSDAADVWLGAAGDAAPDDARRFRRRATEQLLVSGRVDEGGALLGPLLREVGVRFPRTPRAAFGATMLTLLEIAVLGRMGASIGRKPDNDTVDLCFSAARGLIAVDTIRAGYLALVALRLAQRARDPVRIGRSFAMVGGAVLVPAGGLVARWGTRMIGSAQRIAESTGDPYLAGAIGMALGQVGVLTGDWRAALERSRASIQILRERCRGIDWECHLATSGELRALEELGRMREYVERADGLAREARELGDSYALMTAALYIAIARIAQDDVDAGRAQLRYALASWSRDGVHVQHIYALRAEACADLYEGRPRDAWERIREAAPAIERSVFLRVPVTRIDFRLLRARVCLALLASGEGEGTVSETLGGDLRALARERRGDVIAHVMCLRAGRASIAGDSAVAARWLGEAIERFTGAGMKVYRACAMLRLTQLDGASASVIQRTEDSLRDLGVASPEHWVRIWMPGFK